MQETDARLRSLGLIIVGPLGSYISYHLMFVVRYIDDISYPTLYEIYANGGRAIECIIAGTLLLVFTGYALWKPVIPTFDRARQPVPAWSLALILLAVLTLMALSVYRVLGTLDPTYVVDNYAEYNFRATDGGSWMILGCYAAAYFLLLDMFYGGARLSNAAFFLAVVLVTSFSGGRGIIVLFSLAFLVLLLFQRVSLWRFGIAASVTSLVIGLSFVAATEMRDTRTPEQVKQQRDSRLGKAGARPISPTDSFEEMNYNAAFILEDTVKALRNGQIKPANHMAADMLYRWIPRAFAPEKPISTSETYTLYPHVAARGTNITFPLKANLMMHLGEGAFYFDWLIVATFQGAMIWGVRARTIRPHIWAFATVFWGAAFSLISRGGILNARLGDQFLCLALTFLAYILFQAYFAAKGRVTAHKADYGNS